MYFHKNRTTTTTIGASAYLRPVFHSRPRNLFFWLDHQLRINYPWETQVKNEEKGGHFFAWILFSLSLGIVHKRQLYNINIWCRYINLLYFIWPSKTKFNFFVWLLLSQIFKYYTNYFDFIPKDLSSFIHICLRLFLNGLLVYLSFTVLIQGSITLKLKHWRFESCSCLHSGVL